MNSVSNHSPIILCLSADPAFYNNSVFDSWYLRTFGVLLTLYLSIVYSMDGGSELGSVRISARRDLLFESWVESCILMRLDRRIC